MSGHLHPILGIARRLAQQDGLAVRVISSARALPEIEFADLSSVVLPDLWSRR